MIHASIACNLDTAVLSSALPLFAGEEVDAIEWSFDTLFQTRVIPEWFTQLLHAYSEGNRLIGHGVFFSLFSGKWTPDQQKWLDRLKKKCEYFNFDHITEHFGFMTGANFHEGAPISLPFNSTTLALGQDRLKRIFNSCGRPVGLENLAFAYSLDEVKRHGDFLQKLIEPVNGFIILDLHNLYCHLHNFDCSFDEIIRLYPLERVREIHISGGSWENSEIEPTKTVRRDTHDDSVPDFVFELLEKSIPLCPNLKYVVLEQIGNGLKSPESQLNFQQDFRRMKTIISRYSTKETYSTPDTFLPKNSSFSLPEPQESLELHKQQRALANILETAKDYEDAARRLEASCLAGTDWQTETWRPAMLETVVAIAQKWKAE